MFLGCDYFEGLKGYGIQRYLKDVFNSNLGVDENADPNQPPNDQQFLLNLLQKYSKIVANTDLSVGDYLENYENIKEEFLCLNQELEWYQKIKSWTRMNNIMNGDIDWCGQFFKGVLN